MTEDQSLREKIHKAARRLLRRGTLPSLDKIALAAGVSRATFYRMIGSREKLLAEIGIEDGPSAKSRIVEAAALLLEKRGLSALSMEEVIEESGLSRATVYRLFAGRSELFCELVREFAPYQRIAHLIQQHQEQPPEEVVPIVARAASRSFRERQGLIKAILGELTSKDPLTREATREVYAPMVMALTAYISAQIEAGRLQKVIPLVAMQALAGPLLMYALSHDAMLSEIGVAIDEDLFVSSICELWLNALQVKKTPDGSPPPRE
jgi:AcrR family transcriptional regulator